LDAAVASLGSYHFCICSNSMIVIETVCILVV
jgi:hypothetical protein